MRTCTTISIGAINIRNVNRNSEESYRGR
jgi:hypothetical protein